MTIFTELFLPLILALIMLTMGLGLTIGDFRRVARFPRGIVIGLAAQLALLPLLGFALTQLWPMSAEFAVGYMILAAAPGGPVSNYMSYFARGNVALSVSLTALSSSATLITVPLIVNWALGHFLGADAVPLPVGRAVAGLFLISVLPVIVGMTVRALAPRFAARVEPMMARVAFFGFLIVVIGAVAAAWDLVVAHIPVMAAPALLLGVAVMAAGLIVARLARLAEADTRSITIECGLQNGVLAMFVGATLLGQEVFMLPAAAYALLMNAPILAYAYVMRRAALSRP